MAGSDRPAAIPRARAVPDLPVAALERRAEELTRRWAIALIQTWPLDGLGAVPLEELGSHGPELCRAVIGAISSEESLQELLGAENEPVEALVMLAGAADGRALAQAVEALRGAVWELLLEHAGASLSGSSPRALAEASDRLAYVCSRLLADGLERLQEQERETRAVSPGFPVRPVRARGRGVASGPVTILDERLGAEAREGARPPQPPEPDEPGLGGSAGPTARRLAGGASHPVASLEAREIEIRDERREEGPVAWISSIGRQLERFAEDQRPFTVLLVEPLDPEQPRNQRLPDGAGQVLGRLERMLADELAAATAGWLTRERPGRYWLLAPETDRIAALGLQERLRSTVAFGSARLGADMAVAIGTAVCPDDGQRAPALAAHADIGLYAARAEARAEQTRRAGGGALEL